MPPDTPRRLAARIRAFGPIPVADFMAEAVAAYYAGPEPFGVAGDFITAPEISQVFGELVGLWTVVVWQQMGAPETVRLVEAGPGRGTLMADLLRAAAVVPSFLAAAHVHLVETSPRLRAVQRTTLARADIGSTPLLGAPGKVTWHADLTEVPAGPAIVVGNEFLDALPVHQYQRGADGWQERLVGLTEDGTTFCFVPGPVVPSPPLPARVRDTAPAGAIAEASPAIAEVTATLARRLCAQGGAALLIDYGPTRSAPGDSLQAVRRHAPHPVLATPGAADLTAHVDFEAVATAATAAGARVDGPVSQGNWLRRLGIVPRTERLLMQADPAQARAIVAGVRRLTDDAAMGGLFKVIGLAHPALPPLPGLDR